MPDPPTATPSQNPQDEAPSEHALAAIDDDERDEESTDGFNRARDSLRGELAKGTPVSKAIAHALDELIRIPGTNFRFGLDPILGLIPYGGEAVASIIGCFLLADAGKKGVPFRTLLKMSGNVIINATVSTFPLLGDIFSAWFKSNSRNYQMLQHWMDSAEGQQAQGGWGPLLLVCGVGLVVVTITVGMWLLMIGFITSLWLKFIGLLS
jgi:hypothetical protein